MCVNVHIYMYTIAISDRLDRIEQSWILLRLGSAYMRIRKNAVLNQNI